VLAGVVLFLAFDISFDLFSTNIRDTYQMDPIIFFVILAAFAVVAEVGHDLAIKLALRSTGGKSTFRLSLIGIPMTLLSGLLGFVITAAGGTKILRVFESGRRGATVAACGALFNLVLGAVLLYIGIAYRMSWLAFAGAMPNLANAAFSMFPTYPFEGRRVVRGSRLVWGLVFFTSMMFYVYAM